MDVRQRPHQCNEGAQCRGWAPVLWVRGALAPPRQACERAAVAFFSDAHLNGFACSSLSGILLVLRQFCNPVATCRLHFERLCTATDCDPLYLTNALTATKVHSSTIARFLEHAGKPLYFGTDIHCRLLAAKTPAVPHPCHPECGVHLVIFLPRELGGWWGRLHTYLPMCWGSPWARPHPMYVGRPPLFLLEAAVVRPWYCVGLCHCCMLLLCVVQGLSCSPGPRQGTTNMYGLTHVRTAGSDDVAA